MDQDVRLEQTESGTGTDRDGFFGECEGHCGA